MEKSKKRLTKRLYTVIIYKVLRENTISGGNGEGVPPVPIPNTEVKPFSAENTSLETGWKDKSPPDSNIWNTSKDVFFFILPCKQQKLLKNVDGNECL